MPVQAFTKFHLSQEDQAASPTTIIPALTGLRAIAAFLVFFSHFPIPTKRVGGFLAQFCSELYIGVSIFFVLSGFLITLRYSDNFNYSLNGFFKYTQKRFARIYPMYFILTSFTFLYPKMDPSFSTGAYYLATPEASPFTVYLLNISFLRGFFHDFAISGIGQGWTLTVEECFYLLAPLILLVKFKIPLFVHVLFFYLVGFVFVYIFKDINFFGLFSSNKFMLITTFFGRCLEFYMGIQLALWYKRDQTQIPGGRYTYFGILSIVLLVSGLVFTKDRGAEYYYGLYSSTGLVINNFLVPFAIGLVFVGLLRENTIVRKLLENSFTILLGKSSYVFYLIHLGVISELLRKYVTHNYLLNFPLLVLLSITLYKLLESPLNNFIRKL